MEIRIRNIIALFTFMCLRLNMFTTAHESRGNIFAKVVNFLAPGEDYMSENAVRSFFELLEKRVQCSDVSCGKCLSVESVSQLVANFSSSGALGEEDFFRVAAGCCLYLSVSPQACSAIQLGLWAQHTERLILNLTGHGHQEEETGMAMKSMQGLLHDMEKYYRPREGHDPHCLTLNDLLEEGNVSLTHGDRHSLDAVFGIIVYHALRGDCMTAHELPEEGFFLDFIFNRFSSDNFTLHDLESLMRSLNLGDHHDDEHDHLHNEEQHHDDEPRPAREGPGHGHEEGQPQNSSWDSVCFSAAQLVRIHHLNESALSQADFTQLSPALVQQLLSGACSGTIPPVEPTDQLSTTDRYLYATLANLLICLTAMFGIVVLLCTSCSGLFQLSIQFCISLAVGSLTGDALLHLLPTFLGLHVHGAGTSSDHKHSEEDFNYLFKLLVVLGGIYFFYLMEAIFSIITHKDSHHTHNHDEDPHHCDHGKVIQMYQRERQTKQSASQVDLVDDPEKEKDLPSKDKHLLPLMITLGDAIHNFADGLAIGAAFSMSWRSGLATSLAVLCHELPHELGDFAILLHCGMSVKRALALNLGSALTSFLGLYIALSVSTDSAAKEWIAAVTAGLFLYVGLADMLPSMIHVKSSRPWLIFLLQNLGLLTGWGILLLLSFYEDRIGF